MLAAAPETETSFVADGGWESITFLVPPDDIRAHLAARQREGEFHVPMGIEPLQVDVESVRSLFDWGKRLVEMALQEPTIFDGSSKERVARRTNCSRRSSRRCAWPTTSSPRVAIERARHRASS